MCGRESHGGVNDCLCLLSCVFVCVHTDWSHDGLALWRGLVLKVHSTTWPAECEAIISLPGGCGHPLVSVGPLSVVPVCSCEMGC